MLGLGTLHNGGRGGRGGGMTWLPFRRGEGDLVDVPSGRGACLIDNWIGRRWKDRGTSTIAYISRLGTNWDRWFGFAGI